MDADSLNKKLNKTIRELREQLADIYSRLDALEDFRETEVIGFHLEDPYADFDEDDSEY